MPASTPEPAVIAENAHTRLLEIVYEALHIATGQGFVQPYNVVGALRAEFESLTAAQREAAEAKADRDALMRVLASDNARMAADVAQWKDLAELCFTWWDRENSGPDYSPYTRSTHPDQNHVWSEWYNGNLALVAKFMDAMRAARTPTPTPPEADA